MICVSIGRTRHKMVVLEHRALAERGAELVELRIDWLSHMPDLSRLLADRPTPCVVTCRRKSDRGRWRGSEDQRLALLRSAIVAGVEYVDLEDDVAGQIPRYGDTKRIVSHHNFDETPRNLEDIYKRICGFDPDIVKLVTMANAPSDIVRMLRLVADADLPTIGFCMGELGVASRLLCGKYGSPFTYATFSTERELGPGQLSFEEMRKGPSLENRFLPLTKAFVAHNGAVFFIARAAELLLDEWTRLRMCFRGDCRTIFLPRRKDQLYCSDKCASKERVRSA